MIVDCDPNTRLITLEGETAEEVEFLAGVIQVLGDGGAIQVEGRTIKTRLVFVGQDRRRKNRLHKPDRKG